MSLSLMRQQPCQANMSNNKKSSHSQSLLCFIVRGVSYFFTIKHSLPPTEAYLLKGFLVLISGHQIYGLTAFVLVAYYLFLYFVLVTMATTLRLIYIFLEGFHKDSVKNDLIQTKCITWDSECFFLNKKNLVHICDKNIFSTVYILLYK